MHRRTLTRSLTALALLSPAAAVLVACPGSSSDDSTSGTSTGPTAPGSDVGTAPTTGDPGLTGTTSDETTQGVVTVDTTTTLGTGPLDTGDTSSTGSGDTGDTTVSSSSGPGPDTTGESSTGEAPLLLNDIEVLVTADNAYAFGYGTEDGVIQLFGGVEAQTAAEIFECGEGPEKYVIPADDAATAIYLVAWDDSADTNGVLARFRRSDGNGGFGGDAYTGTPGWRVCTTNKKYDIGQGGPSLDVVNEHIARCNAETATPGTRDPATGTSDWFNEGGSVYGGALALGEPNDTPYDGGPEPGNEFPLVCPMEMPAEARWMWFDPDMEDPASPFIYPGGGSGENAYHQFLLFRLDTESIPVPG